MIPVTKCINDSDLNTVLYLYWTSSAKRIIQVFISTLVSALSWGATISVPHEWVSIIHCIISSSTVSSIIFFPSIFYLPVMFASRNQLFLEGGGSLIVFSNQHNASNSRECRKSAYIGLWPLRINCSTLCLGCALNWDDVMKVVQLIAGELSKTRTTLGMVLYVCDQSHCPHTSHPGSILERKLWSRRYSLMQTINHLWSLLAFWLVVLYWLYVCGNYCNTLNWFDTIFYLHHEP